MRCLDLFSGIGGFTLGLEATGVIRTVAFCERDKYRQVVLRKHWPDTPIYDDVRTIPTDGLGKIDIIVGGFPCAPWSQAGKQRGAEDDRDLWPEMATVIEKLRPQWVIGENVRAFTNARMGLERSVSDLEGYGYQLVNFIIPACAVGAPHIRSRVFFLAHTSAPGLSLPERQTVRQTGRRKEGRAIAERGWWTGEPDILRVAYGIPERVDRLKSLGDAIVPQVVEQIGRAIVANGSEQ